MKRTLSNIFRIGIKRIIRKGLRITIIPTYACNYNCSYCGRKMFGKNPRTGLKEIGQWKDYLIKMDKTLRKDRSKIKEIIFNGGEPTIVPYFSELCNWILDQGWLLTVYTNMSNDEPLLKIRQSTNLIIHSTYHYEYADPIEYNIRWKFVDQKHRTSVYELGERRLPLSYKPTNLIPLTVPDPNRANKKIATMRIDPNLAIYLTCDEDVAANL